MNMDLNECRVRTEEEFKAFMASESERLCGCGKRTVRELYQELFKESL